MKKLFAVLLTATLIFSFGCGKKEITKETVPSPDKKLFEMGAPSVKEIQTNTRAYDHMELEQRGAAFKVKLFEGRKVSVESNFKGEIDLLAPNGEVLKKISDRDKFYLPAKEGTYYLWLKNNAVPSDYYIIIKAYNKAAFLEDADAIPGTEIKSDGLVEGVVDSKTDPVDFYSFNVLADSDVKILVNNPNVNVAIVNKIGEETPCQNNVTNDLYIMQNKELYLKVTAKEGLVGQQYAINLKRIKH